MITKTWQQQIPVCVLLWEDFPFCQVSVATEQGEPWDSRHGAGVLLPASPCRPGFVARVLWVPCFSECGTTAILVRL